MDYVPFIGSQLASRNQLEGLLWCKSSHVASQILAQTKIVVHRVSPCKSAATGASKNRSFEPTPVQTCKYCCPQRDRPCPDMQMAVIFKQLPVPARRSKQPLEARTMRTIKTDLS